MSDACRALTMFSSFKFPTLRLRNTKNDSQNENNNQQTKTSLIRSKPPKTPVLGGNRIKRHQRRRSEPGLLPTIAGFALESSAAESDRLSPGDRICSINGIATQRLSNEEVRALLENVTERASLEVEYYLPNYDSQNSLCITSRIAEVTVEKLDGSLGVTLRPAGELCNKDGVALTSTSHSASHAPLHVTHVRPNGPAHSTHRIKPGDRLLKVDNISLANKTLSEAYQILQNSPSVTTLTIEYDISIMESVKFATGPLLIEIERSFNEDLGLMLTDKSCYQDECYQNGDESTGIYIDSIVPASISDRTTNSVT